MKKIFLAFVVLSISILTLAQGSGDLENEFYLRFGYSNPTTSYLGVDNDVFWDYVTRGGGVFELGQIFIINSIPLSDGLRIGINADYAELSYHQLTNTDFDTALGLFKISSKVGPSISYSPIPDLVIDAFIKAKIPWIAGMASVSGGDSDESYAGILGFGIATGINVRYRFLMAGFEFNKDNMMFEDVNNSGEYFGTINIEGEYSDKTPMPSFSFTFGFCF